MAIGVGGRVKAKIAILRNVAWVAMAGYVESAVGLLAGVLIARTLGPAEYGHYAFAVWVCGMLILGGNNALPGASIRFIAEARGGQRDSLAAALGSRFLRWQRLSSAGVLLAFIVAMGVQPLHDWEAQLPAMLAVAVVAVWSRSGFWMLGAIGKGHERFAPENLALALTALLNAAGVVLLAVGGASALQFFMLYAVLGIASSLLVRRLLAREGLHIAPGPIPTELGWRIRRHVKLTGLTMLLSLSTAKAIEMSLLKVHTSTETVGYFAIAISLTKGAVDLLAGGLAAVLMPAMARRFGEAGRGALGGMLAESTRLYWFAGLAIAGLGLTVGEGIVHLLYGQRYEAAIPVLMWSLVVAGITVVSGAAAAVLVASDHQQDRLKVLAATLALNLAVAFWLVPIYGLTGAIISFGLTQVFEMALNWAFALRRITVRLPTTTLVRQGLAAVCATGLGALLVEQLHQSLAFVGGALIFLVVYITLCVRLRTIRASEFEVIAHLVSRLGHAGASIGRRIDAMQRYAMDEPADPAAPV
jgi:O-antigen/teichoic acid export membrane protein